MRRLVAVALIVAACGGSDPLAGVDNCSQLLEAVSAHVAEIEGDSSALSAFSDRVEEVAVEMAGDAIARGAELEAAICAEAIVEAGSATIRQTFDEIGSGLDGG